MRAGVLTGILFCVRRSVGKKLRKELWESRQVLHLLDLLSAACTSNCSELRMAVIGI